MAVDISSAGALLVQQYLSSELVDATIAPADGRSARVHVVMSSGLPWEGQARIEFFTMDASGPGKPVELALHLRRPVWGGRMAVNVNGSVAAAGDLSHPPARPAREAGRPAATTRVGLPSSRWSAPGRRETLSRSASPCPSSCEPPIPASGDSGAGPR